MNYILHYLSLGYMYGLGLRLGENWDNSKLKGFFMNLFGLTVLALIWPIFIAGQFFVFFVWLLKD